MAHQARLESARRDDEAVETNVEEGYMTPDEARELLRRYRAAETACISSLEWADAVEAAFKLADERKYFIPSVEQAWE